MAKSYYDLSSIISFDDFHFENYSEDEVSVLQPRLESLGYKNITWLKGETDSFGPLTRICHAYTADNQLTRFMYG
jgi:hypothetical protein